MARGIITPRAAASRARRAAKDAAPDVVAHPVEHSAAPVPVVGCGCGVDHDGDAEGRKAVAVDADAKERNVKRLRRLEGQVRGIQRMVEEDRYCADVLMQISAVQEALRGVSRELMRNHLKHCATAAIKGTPEQADAMYDELVNLMHKHSR